VHQRRVASQQRGGIEAALFEFTRAGVADDNVRGIDQPAEVGGRAHLRYIKGRQDLAAVPAELAGVPRAAGFPRRHHPHHLSAEIGEEHARGSTGEAAGQFEDTDS
jgi:hypothetical protein